MSHQLGVSLSCRLKILVLLSKCGEAGCVEEWAGGVRIEFYQDNITLYVSYFTKESSRQEIYTGKFKPTAGGIVSA